MVHPQSGNPLCIDSKPELYFRSWLFIELPALAKPACFPRFVWIFMNPFMRPPTDRQPESLIHQKFSNPASDVMHIL
jgi:hypothetical protein